MDITKNRVVTIDYTLTDSEQQVLDTTKDGEPLEYLHGHGNIIPGLEKALEGKTQGDQITVTVPAADGYGERNEELVMKVPRDRFQGDDTIEEGMQFEAQTPDGYRVVTVTNVEDKTVTIDANHPLAGADLNFQVTITAVREAKPEELSHGHVHSHGHAHGHDDHDHAHSDHGHGHGDHEHGHHH
jgi:FKBP-type peptidyl-prolyl cis-trans isomerase SlyD